jgi:hypothetical protein
MPSLSRSNCRCGASRQPSESRCRKCRDRAQWYRRKAWRLKNTGVPRTQGSDLP